MAVELATGYVSLIPSTRGMAGQVRREMAGPLDQAGTEAGGRFGGVMTGVAGKALKAGAVGIAAGFAASIVKGFGRLRALDDARFKLQGLGHDAGTVDQIMSDALASVKGTAFGLGDAATIAAGAVAAGVKPGKGLERTLSLTGDAASIAGTSLGEMGQIFGKVAAGNRMMTEEMNQLTERGVPILQYLQDEFGITATQAREMVSKGQVDFATFQRLIENNIGGAALTAGASFRGSFDNMGAALGRFGAAILGPAFAAAPSIFSKITFGLDAATTAIGPLVDWFQRFQTPIMVVAGLIASLFIPHLLALAATSTISAAKQAAAWLVTQAGAIKAAVVHSGQVVRMVAGWVLMGAQSLIQGARMAAAWVIAMGPVGWVIAAVVALAALIIANWDKVVAFTRKAWTWVTDKIGAAWTWVKNTTSSAVAAVVGFFAGLRDRAAAKVTELRNRVVGFFGDLRTSVIGIATGIRDRVVEFFVGLRDGAVEKVDALIERVMRIKDDVLGFFSGAGRWLLDAGKNIVQGLIDGIGKMVGKVKDAIGSVVSSITDRLPWSPAKAGPLRKRPPEKGGANIVAGIVKGMGGQLGTLSAMADAAARAAMPAAAVNVPRASGVRAASYNAAGGDADRLKADRVNQRILAALERMSATPLLTAQRSAELVHV